MSAHDPQTAPDHAAAGEREGLQQGSRLGEPAHPEAAPRGRENGRGGWLWISAGVLAALVVVQGAGLLDRPALAEMVSERSG